MEIIITNWYQIPLFILCLIVAFWIVFRIVETIDYKIKIQEIKTTNKSKLDQIIKHSKL